MAKAMWLDRPDGEGWFWVWWVCGDKTVVRVEHTRTGRVLVNRNGYAYALSGDAPEYAEAKWKRIHEPMDPR